MQTSQQRKVAILVVVAGIGLGVGTFVAWFQSAQAADSIKVNQIRPLPITYDLLLDSKKTPPLVGLKTAKWIELATILQQDGFTSVEPVAASVISDRSYPIIARVTAGYVLQLAASNRRAMGLIKGPVYEDQAWVLGRSVLYNALLDSDYTSAIDLLSTSIVESGLQKELAKIVAVLQQGGWDISDVEIGILTSLNVN